jgi:hypothetical protein
MIRARTHAGLSIKQEDEMRTYYFLVTGAGAFPFAELSRDKAWPATLDDAEKIEYSCPTQAKEQTIRLASRTHPTPDRWKAAKWPVSQVVS